MGEGGGGGLTGRPAARRPACPRPRRQASRPPAPAPPPPPPPPAAGPLAPPLPPASPRRGRPSGGRAAGRCRRDGGGEGSVLPRARTLTGPGTARISRLLPRHDGVHKILMLSRCSSQKAPTSSATSTPDNSGAEKRQRRRACNARRPGRPASPPAPSQHMPAVRLHRKPPPRGSEEEIS